VSVLMAIKVGCVIMVCAMITIRIHTLFQLAMNVIRRIILRINVDILQGCPVGFVLIKDARTEKLAVIAMKTSIVFLEIVMLLLVPTLTLTLTLLVNNTAKIIAYDWNTYIVVLVVVTF